MYDTEEERAAAKKAQGAKRQRQFSARQRAKPDSVVSADTDASETAPEGIPPSSSKHPAPPPGRVVGKDEEPHGAITDDPTLERTAIEESPRESGPNLLYWATVLGDRTGWTPKKPAVNSIDPSDVPASESHPSLPTGPYG
jgi:hypothetical protein